MRTCAEAAMALRSRARMRPLRLTGMFGLLSVVATAPLESRETADPRAGCASTPLEDRLPAVIAPMAGKDPIWLAGGRSSSRPDVPTKAVWVLSRKSTGGFRLEGRQLEGPGIVRFRTSVEAPTTEAVLIPDPQAQSVVPGGATPEIMTAYAFVPTYLIYPGPGCWELVARLGEREVRIVIAIKGKPKRGA